MFGFGKKVEIKKIDINEGFRQYKKNPDKITIICLDELKDYDELHIADAECFPFRLLDRFEESYPNKNMKYYLYAINKALSEKACKKLLKKDYDVYDLGSFLNYREREEGFQATRKNRRRKR